MQLYKRVRAEFSYLILRALKMLYDGLKQNSTVVIVPSSAVETMGLGSMAGLTALTMGLGQDNAQNKSDKENGTVDIASAEQPKNETYKEALSLIRDASFLLG